MPGSGETISAAVRRRLADARPLAREVAGEFRRHGLGVHATAIAFRVLVSLVPLTLLAIGLLGATGLEDVWADTVSPALRERLSRPVADAADYVALDIFRTGGPWLIAFASGLFVYDTALGVRMVQRTLNTIHDTGEQRGRLRTTLVTLGLALACDVVFVAAFGVVVVGGRVDGFALELARWPLAVALLGLGVALLLRYAPAERPEARWASAGSALIVGGWLVASVLFGVWVTQVADYRSAIGNLTAFLVLTAYTLAVSAVFVAGAQLDETLRTNEHAGSRGRSRA